LKQENSKDIILLIIMVFLLRAFRLKMRQKYGAPVKVWCGMLIEAGKFKEYIIINHYGLLAKGI
jgi:hypothetical protein